MRILIIGFMVFLGWTFLSTYIYVCKIRGLCAEPQTELMTEANPNNLMPVEPLASEVITNPTEANPDRIKPIEQLASEEVTIPTDLVVHFAFDKSDFISGAKASEYFDASNAYLKSNKQAMLSITGHTDAIGTAAYNQALGLRRAQTMQRYFVSKGISASRISIESKGEKEPVADNNSDEGRAKNRRSVVTIK
jgi:outer membrane protein OmpA-like peptidoglycan-associated protein